MKRRLLKHLGPGLLYAAAAIGVSHLVQSTRAGAGFGFSLVWVVILANVLKFPFFEYGPRYAAATGKSLIEGYRRLGGWAIAVFLIMTLGTIFVIQAAVTVVTAGLLGNLTGIALAPWQWSAIVLLVCLLVLVIGHYHLLDRLIKVIISILTITTVIAVVFAGFADVDKDASLMTGFDWRSSSNLAFLIALIGWMPAPLDIAVWHSVWSVAKKRDEEAGSTKGALFDFRVGYWGTTFLALCFLTLGALIMYGTGEEIASKGLAFSKQLIALYTTTLGEWTWPVISLAAFTTMFSTTLTVLDAYPRVLRPTSRILFPTLREKASDQALYWFWILFTIAGTMVILLFYLSSMTALVDFVTTLSFILAPIFAIMNYTVITGPDMPEEHKPGRITRAISWVGMVFMVAITVLYFLDLF